MEDFRITRRRCVGAAAGLLLAGALPWPLRAWGEEAAPITRAIPSTGQRLPIIGLGASGFSVSGPEELAQRREVLAMAAKVPGLVIDTAQSHGRSEQVVGQLLAELGLRDRFFLASKLPSGGAGESAEQLLERSFTALRTAHIDLMQVHNLFRLDAFMPVLLRAKAEGRIRHVGISASPPQYGELLRAMQRFPVDFIQLDYSLALRELAQRVLETAAERRCAVLAGAPFGGRVRAGTMFSLLAGRPLPEWAAEIDARSWAQVLLKYVASHPAVTAVLPGTSRPAHLQDNLQAAYGRLPDAQMRIRIERYWEAVRGE